jgi:hypothetical protein
MCNTIGLASDILAAAHVQESRTATLHTAAIGSTHRWVTNWVTIALINHELLRTPAHLVIEARSLNRTGYRSINIVLQAKSHQSLLLGNPKHPTGTLGKQEPSTGASPGYANLTVLVEVVEPSSRDVG